MTGVVYAMGPDPGGPKKGKTKHKMQTIRKQNATALQKPRKNQKQQKTCATKKQKTHKQTHTGSKTKYTKA